MSSSTNAIKNKSYHSGFEQVNIYNRSKIGTTINEGYTELLSRRYFNPCHDSYAAVVFIAKTIEYVVEKNKMQKLYMNADLKGLIEVLKEYAAEEEILKFICRSNYAFKYIKKSLIIKNRLVQEAITNTTPFLLKLFLKKLENELASGKISKSEFCCELRLF